MFFSDAEFISLCLCIYQYLCLEYLSFCVFLLFFKIKMTPLHQFKMAKRLLHFWNHAKIPIFRNPIFSDLLSKVYFYSVLSMCIFYAGELLGKYKDNVSLCLQEFAVKFWSWFIQFIRLFQAYFVHQPTNSGRPLILKPGQLASLSLAKRHTP